MIESIGKCFLLHHSIGPSNGVRHVAIWRQASRVQSEIDYRQKPQVYCERAGLLAAIRVAIIAGIAAITVTTRFHNSSIPPFDD